MTSLEELSNLYSTIIQEIENFEIEEELLERLIEERPTFRDKYINELLIIKKRKEIYDDMLDLIKKDIIQVLKK